MPEIPVIDRDRCSQCLTCRKSCPGGCIYTVHEMPFIDYRCCNGCGACYAECPINAVEMVPEGCDDKFVFSF